MSKTTNVHTSSLSVLIAREIELLKAAASHRIQSSEALLLLKRLVEAAKQRLRDLLDRTPLDQAEKIVQAALDIIYNDSKARSALLKARNEMRLARLQSQTA